MIDDAGHATGTPWHALEPDVALQRLQSAPQGLTADEAAARLARHGPNRFPAAPRPGAWRRLLAQFSNPLIYVLLAAAAASAALGHGVDTAVILAVVLANAAIGFVQEGRAESALAAIRELLTPRAAVLRDGRRADVEAAALVPGDLVLLEAGDRVAADLRLLEARRLAIDEATLTGESVPVEKQVAPVCAEAPIGDRASVAHAGTLVTAGRAVGVVVATGAATELGRIGTLLGSVTTVSTPLLRQMDAFAKRLTLVVLAIAAGVYAFGTLVRDYAPGEMLMIVVGVAVAAIPEGLPAILTITLAIGVQRMAARHAIVRRLPAVETLGAVSVICSDKTGTLTRNEMVVRRVATADAVYDVEGAGYATTGALWHEGRPVAAHAVPALAAAARVASLCNDAELVGAPDSPSVSGDPMEGALLAFAAKVLPRDEAPRRRWERVDTLPFDPVHRYMATLVRCGDATRLLVKGAPERVLAMCGHECVGAGERPLAAAPWLERIDALAAGGARVLALAERVVPAGNDAIDALPLEGELTLVALVGLVDPPREDAIEAVRDCRSAGIRVKMITGDHAATALAIARQLGFPGAAIVATGRDLDGLDGTALREIAVSTDVFARTSPEHKLRLVEALQADGAVVAMTGDGVNDAPALKRADVGVAMGRKGTEAAKEAAAMVLADDHFASIVGAVREGRIVHDNLRKAIAWALPTNGGEMLVIVVAVLLGLALPVTPLQILWINTVTAIALGVTLAFEPAEPGLMSRPPRRPGESLLSGTLAWRVAFVSVLIAVAAFAAFEWALAEGATTEVARTVAVNAIVVCEVAYLFSVRRLHSTVLDREAARGTRAVLLGVGAIALAQLAFTYAPPLRAAFGSAPLGAVELGFVIATGVAFLLAVEAEKALLRGLAGRASTGGS
ncbi:MAG: cation-translocating P-type ATPase [Pseudomonadota bacterium]